MNDSITRAIERKTRAAKAAFDEARQSATQQRDVKVRNRLIEEAAIQLLEARRAIDAMRIEPALPNFEMERMLIAAARGLPARGQVGVAA